VHGMGASPMEWALCQRNGRFTNAMMGSSLTVTRKWVL
jgi:hypothetical protein